MNLSDILVIKSIKGVGDKTITEIIKFVNSKKISSLEELSTVQFKDFPLKTVSPALKDFINNKAFDLERKRVNEELAQWHAQGICVVNLGSENYPNQLLDLSNPPPFLYCKGNLKLLKKTKAIAVVGTRKNTARGEQITTKTIEKFSQSGFLIVSGLALGIDTIAHKASLEFNAPTIAVLVDIVNISPSRNKTLAESILKYNGLLIAENPPETRAIPAYFAKRDRIQAGLSSAVFAIETSINGGTMHAVNSAIQMRRPVYVPDIAATNYPDLSIDAISGIRQLIEKKKATPYTKNSYDEIIEKLNEISRSMNSSNEKGCSK